MREWKEVTIEGDLTDEQVKDLRRVINHWILNHKMETKGQIKVRNFDRRYG